MMLTRIKQDESYDHVEGVFESRREYEESLRDRPRTMPATHVWDFWYIDPLPEALAKNRLLLPKIRWGPRELTLAEVSARTDDFTKLGMNELRWLMERHKVPALPLDKARPKLDDESAMREAVRAFAKRKPVETTEGKGQTVSTHSDPAAVSTLPDDIAKMDKPSIETEAARLDAHDEYKKLASKPITVLREWLATKRAATKRQPELQSA